MVGMSCWIFGMFGVLVGLPLMGLVIILFGVDNDDINGRSFLVIVCYLVEYMCTLRNQTLICYELRKLN